MSIAMLLGCARVLIAGQGLDDGLEIRGHGPVVVFESGLGEGSRSWDQVTKALTGCFTTVTYDRRHSHWHVQATPGRITAAAVADDLLARLKAKAVAGPYILVGHSIGGLYVQAFARNHPKDVSGIVLVDAASPLEPPGVFVSSVPPKAGSIEAAEEAGVGMSVAALNAGRPMPPIPLRVIAASDHGDTPQREALWLDVQKRTAALSPKGRFSAVTSGHFIQNDRPDVVVMAVLDVAKQTGVDVRACPGR